MSLFYEFLNEDGMTFEEFESRSISYGHAAIADAISMALECKDKSLCAGLPDGCKVHDRRPKTPASEVGDLSLSYRRVRDACGNTVVPLADHLDLPWCARVTPGARSFWLGALACAFANLVLMGPAAVLFVATGGFMAVLDDSALADLDARFRAFERSQVSSELFSGSLASSAQALLKLGIETTVLAGVSLLAAGEVGFMTFFAFVIVVTRACGMLMAAR